MKRLILASTALMIATAALAQTAPVAPAVPPAPPPPTAHPMSDKVMTRAETVAMVREHFGRMDADKDGSITTQEIEQNRGKWAEKRIQFDGGAPHTMRFERHDPNAAFDRLDANKDGSISREEFAKAHEERIERRVEIRNERREGAKDGKAVRHVMREHRMGGFGGRMIVMADSNKDGRITLAEAEAMALQHFDQMDANKDGRVTPEERRAGRPMIIKQIREEKTTG